MKNVTMGQVVAAIAVISAIGGGLAYMGLDPTPALRTHVEEVAGEVTINREMILRDRRFDALREIDLRKRRVKVLEQAGQDASTERDIIIQLERQYDEADRALQRIRVDD